MYEALLSMVRAYQRHGPVFQLGDGAGAITVLAGPEANLLLARGGDAYFSNREFYGHFVQELGSERFIVATDGPEHRQMRRVLYPAFNREAIASYAPQIAAITRDLAVSWQPGQRLEVVQTFRRLITNQLALLMTGQRADSCFDALSIFFQTLVASAISSRDRQTALQSPVYQAARAQVFAFVRAIIESHASTDQPAQPDLIDLLLAAQRADGAGLADHDILAAALLPFFGGIDTVANSCALMLYALLKHPELYAQATAEARALFADGCPSAEQLVQCPWLKSVAMETLRIYPVAPAAVRFLTRPCAFAGQLLPAGQMYVIATPVSHFLPELFPAPLVFDPLRFWAPRNEHQQPGAYAPFFKGPHTCIGAKLGVIQLVATVGTLLAHTRLQLDPPEYVIDLVVDPILTPKGGYHVLVQGDPSV